MRRIIPALFVKGKGDKVPFFKKDHCLFFIMIFFVLIGTAQQACAVDVVGRIHSIEPNGKRLRVIVIPESIVPATPAQRLRLSFPAKNNDHLQPGDTIGFIAKIYAPYPPLVPGGFDWQEWLYHRNISHIGYSMGRIHVLSQEIAHLPRLTRWRIMIERARYQTTQRWIKNAPDSETGAFASALYTGMRGGMSSSMLEAMRVSGLTHLLSISGLHMSLVAGLVYITMRYALALFVFRFPVKRVAAALAWLCSLFYLFFSGADIPTQRSFIMISLVLLAVMTDRQPFSLWTVFISACVVLALDPHALLNPGFQMSYVAVISLIVYYQRHRHTFDVESTTALKRTGLYFYGLFISTFWVNLTTAPIVAWHFYRFSVYGPLANMIAIPLSSFFLMPLIILAAIATPFGMEGPFLWVFSWGAQALFWVARFIEGLPQSNILLGAYDVRAFWCFLLASFVFLFVRGWWRLTMLPLVLLGVFLITKTERPDMLISHDGNHLVLIQPNHLTIYTRRLNYFVFEKWGDYYGVPFDNITIVPLNDKKAPSPLCVDKLCLIPFAPQKIAAMPLSASALEAACSRTDVGLLLTPYTAPEGCRVPHIIDRVSLKRTGSQVIWLNPYRIVTDAEIRGPKPWNEYEK